MAKRQAQKSVRDLVRDTFTPSRVGLLSWAFAAVIMGTVGLASYQFSYRTAKFVPAIEGPGGLALPPGGDVVASASIPQMPGQGSAVELMQLPENAPPDRNSDITSGQIEVLQREIVGLRRRLSALSEQNLAYSRRIAALEKQVAVAKLSSGSKPLPAPTGPAAEPGAGVVITRAGPVNQAAPRPAETLNRDAVAVQDNTARAPREEQIAGAKPAEQHNFTPRLISLYRNAPEATEQAAQTIDPEEPVRIIQQQQQSLPLPQVKLPETAEPPVSTGSIPKATEATLPDTFDATPTQTTLRPKVITPSSPSGRLRGGGDRQLKRSDFGAIIGHYRTSAGAAKAWADFKTQNAERMRDLRPLLMQRQTPEGGIALMVGPFANAADAAVACLHLLDVAELCHPALFAGDPLVTAAEFRDSAF